MPEAHVNQVNRGTHNNGTNSANSGTHNGTNSVNYGAHNNGTNTQPSPSGPRQTGQRGQRGELLLITSQKGRLSAFALSYTLSLSFAIRKR